MSSFQCDYNVGEIVLRKDKNFWIFPTDYLYSGKYISSRLFSYMGEKWHLIKLPYAGYDLSFCLWRKVQSNLPNYKYIMQLSLELTCTQRLLQKTENIDPDYGSKVIFSRYCSCNDYLKKHIFSMNNLVKVFFDIQNVQRINDAPDITEGDKVNENEQNNSDKDEESNVDEEKNEDEVSSDDEGTSKTKGIKRLAENLKQVFLDGKMSDVVLKVDNREFKVHKLILTARSSVFASMFEHDLAERNTNVVDIPDCAAESFEIFLNYLYSGKIESLSTSNVYNVYYAADKYYIDDLKEKCVIFMKTNLSVETFCDTISLSLRHGESKLQESAVDFFCRNIKEIIKTIHWQNYMAANPTQANELLIKALN